MPGIDETLNFYPLRIAVLTVSDTRTEETDSSGRLIVERLTAAGHELAGRAIVTDEVEAIRLRSRPGRPTPVSTSSSAPAAPASPRATSRPKR